MYQQLGYHVLAFDYRGFADSSRVYPNEVTMTEDAMAVFNLVEEKLTYLKPRISKIIVHGHSLGTGVASRLGAELSRRGNNHTFTTLL